MDYEKATDSDSPNDSFPILDNEEESDTKMLIESLKDCLDYYKEQNGEMEDLMKNFVYLKTSSIETKKALDELQLLQENIGCKDITVEAALMSASTLSEQLRKKDNYIAKIKLYTKLYKNLNEKYSNYIKFFQNELQKSEHKIDHFQVSNMLADIASIQYKKKRCEEALLKLDGNCHSLKYPQMNITSISKEIEVLNQLQLEKLHLESELKEFEGLKPNVLQAQEQLKEIKQEYDQYKMHCN